MSFPIQARINEYVNKQIENYRKIENDHIDEINLLTIRIEKEIEKYLNSEKLIIHYRNKNEKNYYNIYDLNLPKFGYSLLFKKAILLDTDEWLLIEGNLTNFIITLNLTFNKDPNKQKYKNLVTWLDLPCAEMIY